MAVTIINTLSPLRFSAHYEELLPEDYAFGQDHPLLVPIGVIPSFQLISKSGSENIGIQNKAEQIMLRRENSYSKWDITEQVRAAGLAMHILNGIMYIVCPEIRLKDIKLPEGRYYLEIVWNTKLPETLQPPATHSDTFCMTAGSDDLLCLEYGNSYNIEMSGKGKGGVWFEDGFKFRCYLDTQIGKPEYYFEEEVKERLGYSFIESQVSKKIYKFTFLAPEYLCDALRIVRLCENKRITSRGKTYDLLSFNMNPQWQEQGDLASVECEFETDTVIANLGGYTKAV